MKFVYAPVLLGLPNQFVVVPKLKERYIGGKYESSTMSTKEDSLRGVRADA